MKLVWAKKGSLTKLSTNTGWLIQKKSVKQKSSKDNCKQNAINPARSWFHLTQKSTRKVIKKVSTENPLRAHWATY
jgi:hypothetical protein